MDDSLYLLKYKTGRVPITTMWCSLYRKLKFFSTVSTTTVLLLYGHQYNNIRFLSPRQAAIASKSTQNIIIIYDILTPNDNETFRPLAVNTYRVGHTYKRSRFGFLYRYRKAQSEYDVSVTTDVVTPDGRLRAAQVGRRQAVDERP